MREDMREKIGENPISCVHVIMNECEIMVKSIMY